MSAELHDLGVAALGRALAARQVSSAEVVEHLLARIEGGQALGAFLHVAAAAARAQARDIDARRARGEALGPLGLLAPTTFLAANLADDTMTADLAALTIGEATVLAAE